MMSLPGEIPDAVVEQPEPPPKPKLAVKVKTKTMMDATHEKQKLNPNVWPRLGPRAMSRLQDHQLPGDSFVSLRFKSKKNFRLLVFFPSVLLAFLSDSTVLCHETAAALDGKGEPVCVWGHVAEDVFTGRKYCPAIAGFSPWYWSVGWYGMFILTCLVVYWRGQRMKRGQRGANHSAFCYFLDCTRAGYTDRHLATWFATLTLAFFNSILIRLVSTPEGEDILNSCVRYGDWADHGDYCQPVGLLEPSWTVVLLGVYSCFTAALMDQGTIMWDGKKKSDQEVGSEGDEPLRSASPKSGSTNRFLEEEMNLVLAAAVKLKALVRLQMQKSREKQLESNSTLAEFMLAPLTGMAFVLGREEEEEVDGTSLQDLEETFEQSLVEIFGALEFEHIVKREETSSSETTKVMDLCAPDALMRERASVRFRMSGCSNPVAWENSMKRFDQYESSAKNWSVLSETVDIMQLYKFCNYLDGYKSGEVVRAPTSKLSTKATTGCGCSGHVVFGFILGLLGFYLFSFLAPQGDSYAWVYYWVDRQEFVQVRCTETNSTSSSSPWCDATDYLLMSRTTLWVSHAAMLNVTRNQLGVLVAAASKATVLGILASLLAVTVHKTVLGLQQATHPMQILDAILAWWARADHMSTCHLHVWKLARDSLLHTDVKNILDRYENVVLAYLAVSFWLLTDSAIQVAIFNNAPNMMAGYVLVIMCGCTFLCVYQALRVHYGQLQHITTLRRLKESTFVYGDRPDLVHQRRLIDEMISRMSGGGDYQTRLLYMPLNPTFQKGVFAYFITASVSVLARLITEAVTMSRPLGAFDTLANATVNNATAKNGVRLLL